MDSNCNRNELQETAKGQLEKAFNTIKQKRRKMEKSERFEYRSDRSSECLKQLERLMNKG